MLEINAREEIDPDDNIAERWSDESWAWIESNEPYGVKYDEQAAIRREEALHNFIDDESQREPNIEFPDIDIDEVNDAILRYDAMLFEMHSHTLGAEGEYLHEHVSRKIAELTRLRYVHYASTTNDTEHRRQLRQRSVELSEALFGLPRRGKALHYINALKERALASDTESAQELASLLPDYTDGDVDLPRVLSVEAINILKSDIEEIFSPALEVIDNYEDKGRTPEEAKVIIQEVIDAMGLEGAVAELTQGNGFEVSGGRLSLQIGANRKTPITNQALRTVVLHELTHLWGYWNAQKRGENAIQKIGMPGTLQSEEGKAGCVEQIMKQKATERGGVYYVACSLFMGTVDGVKRDFREVYEILWRRSVMESGVEDEEVIATAKYNAARSTLRAYRGLSCDTRDLSYSDGNDIAVDEFEEIASLPREQRLARLRFILSHRVNYREPTEMTIMGYVDISENS